MDEEKDERDFITTYNKDFLGKTGKPAKDNRVRQEFRDPVAAPYWIYLTTGSDKEQPEEPAEDADTYLGKLETTNPEMCKKTFPTPINKEAVRGFNTLYKPNNSLYYINYCTIDGGKWNSNKDDVEVITLPDDCDIPATTQRFCFRHPRSMAKNPYERKPTTRPENLLDPNMEERKILKITTGETEYGDCIGKLGDLVVRTQLHGILERPECDCLLHHG